VGATQFLLLPDARTTGIESAELLRAGAPNYFADAWDSRSWVERFAARQLTRDWISLAINSEQARTQNQLHIHMDCVRADVRQALSDHAGDIGEKWAAFPVPLAGHYYSAMRIFGANLEPTNPLTLLADGLPGARAAMGLQTLVVVGTVIDERPGFVLLADHVDATTGDRAGGEELQDHTSCPAANP
jgi:CDP-diacylglycerol pyrophosphatase